MAMKARAGRDIELSSRIRQMARQSADALRPRDLFGDKPLSVRALLKSLGLERRIDKTSRLRGMMSPSAEDRLPKSLHFVESDVIIGVVRARSVHEVGYGHKWHWEA